MKKLSIITIVILLSFIGTAQQPLKEIQLKNVNVNKEC